MNCSVAETPPQERIRAIDPDLPMLAAQAAIELDNFALGRGSSASAVCKLASRLKNAFQPPNGTGSRRSLMDVSTKILVGRALDSSRIGSPTTEVNEKMGEVWEVANQLEVVGQHTAPDVLAQLRGFCTALAKNAASYRRSIHDLTPSHPFRR